METKLDSREAAKIRACEFEARAGWKRPWRCPLLPDRLLWEYPALQHMSDAIERLWLPRYGGWNPKRARPIQIAPRDPVSKLDQRFLRILRSGPLAKRELQRRLWRIPATIFNAALLRLIAEGWIIEHLGSRSNAPAVRDHHPDIHRVMQTVKAVVLDLRAKPS
jgi:hypothetical protein